MSPQSVASRHATVILVLPLPESHANRDLPLLFVASATVCLEAIGVSWEQLLSVKQPVGPAT